MCDNIINISQQLPDSQLIIAGDLNTKTGAEPRFILDDSPLYLPGGEYYGSSDFQTPRHSQDNGTNLFGESLLGLCKSPNVNIVNGRTHSDLDGHMTFVSPTGV